MDVFHRTFTNTHLAVLRRCVDRDDPTVLIARYPGGCLMLTRHRLVVTRRTRFLNRLRLHLNANLRHLSNFSWSVDASQSALAVNLTAVDGVREHFVLRLANRDEVRRVEAVLRGVVSPRTDALTA